MVKARTALSSLTALALGAATLTGCKSDLSHNTNPTENTKIPESATPNLLVYTPTPDSLTPDFDMTNIEPRTTDIFSTTIPSTVDPYTISEVIIGDKTYRAVPLPFNKTAEIEGKVYDRAKLENTMLIPLENHTETLRQTPNGTTLLTLEPNNPGDYFFLVPCHNDGNTPDNLRMSNTPEELASRTRATLDVIIESQEGINPDSSDTAQRTTYLEETNLRMIEFNNGRQGGTKAGYFPINLNPDETTLLPPHLQKGFLTESSNPIRQRVWTPSGEVTTRLTLSGTLYVPIQGNLVNIPKTPKPQDSVADTSPGTTPEIPENKPDASPLPEVTLPN